MKEMEENLLKARTGIYISNSLHYIRMDNLELDGEDSNMFVIELNNNKDRLRINRNARPNKDQL